MQIDKLFDEECELIQKLKKIFNEMNVCATQTFNYNKFLSLADDYNKTVDKLTRHVEKRMAMRKVNLESMTQSLKHHFGSKSK